MFTHFMRIVSNNFVMKTLLPLAWGQDVGNHWCAREDKNDHPSSFLMGQGMMQGTLGIRKNLEVPQARPVLVLFHHLKYTSP